jgi:prolipoprotein diacylglyceryl transferase
MILLRAYASIWDFVNDVFGTNFMSLPPQTYGFFMAIAFLAGILLAKQELARKTVLGIFEKGTKEYTEGLGMNWVDIFSYALFGFFVGLKAIGIYLDRSAFTSNPQSYFLSLEGSTVGGILVGTLVAAYVAFQQNKKKLDSPVKKLVSYNVEDRIGDVLVISMIGGILGSKILDAVDNPASMADFINNPLVSLTSGLSVLGGLWLVSLLLILYARHFKIKFLAFADSLAPPFFMSYAIGRLGCQFSGDGCWGIESTNLTQPSWLPNFLWGQTYPHNVNNDGLPISGCTEPYCMELEFAHLPTPLYETIFVTILFLILWSLRRRLTMHFGAMTGLFFMFNGIERFCIEFVRINTKYPLFGLHFSQAQYMSLAMIILGLGLFYWSIFIQKKQISS